MENKECCVCNAPIMGEAKQYKDRFFCSPHYERISNNRKNLWLIVLTGILGSLLFVAIAGLFDKVIFSDRVLMINGFIKVLVSLVPLFLWMLVFYRLDYLEPEPKSYVAGVFVLGFLLAGGLAAPLLQALLPALTYGNIPPVLQQLVESILIVGIMQEGLKYFGLRLTIYNNKEFDERVDGIIYGAAIGLGFSLTSNLQFLASSSSVSLYYASIAMVITTLSHASFGAITGVFLGLAKFEKKNAFWLSGGVLLAAVLNGFSTYFIKSVSNSGLKYRPEIGLIAAGCIASAIFFSLLFLVYKINTKESGE